VLATHAIDSDLEIVTETGKSPIVSTGVPTIVRTVGSEGEMLRREAVLEPGFKAIIVCGLG
jgi:hypothetical protein